MGVLLGKQRRVLESRECSRKGGEAWAEKGKRHEADVGQLVWGRRSSSDGYQGAQK